MKAAMSMTQFFQQITESAIEVDGLRNTLRSPRIDGDRIRFGFTDGTGVLRQFDGRISGSRITGAVTGPGGSTAPFSAERTGATPPIGGCPGILRRGEHPRRRRARRSVINGRLHAMAGSKQWPALD